MEKIIFRTKRKKRKAKYILIEKNNYQKSAIPIGENYLEKHTLNNRAYNNMNNSSIYYN